MFFRRLPLLLRHRYNVFVPIERERLDADVLITGAGPAGLACALRLAQLAAADQKAGREPAVSPPPGISR